jgi:predicted permease
VLAEIEDMPMAPGDAGQLLQQVIVGPGYFDMAGAGPVRGRLFDSSDVYDGQMVVVVEERLAESYWPGEDPIGKRLRWLDQTETRWLTVVGVVPDLVQAPSLEFAGNHPVVYTPYAQEPLRSMSILVRSGMGPEAVAGLLREEVQQIDANLPLYDIQTLQASIDERATGFRVVSVLFFLLGGIALFLSCIGIYAVMAFAVGRRQQEIGIRMALGAQRGEVLRLVLRRALVQTTVGLTIGLLLALVTTRALGMYLYQVSPNDPLVFAFAVVALITTAVLSSLVPANRAGRVDPLEALRAS